MANKKISTLTAIGTTPDASDVIPITDVSDTSGSAQGTTKKVTVGNLRAKDIVTKTLSFTLSDAENGKVVWCNSAARVDITVPSGLVSGFNCQVVQGGTGKVRFLTSGTTINGYISASNTPNATIGQHGVADLIPTASDTYVLMGDIEYLFVFGNTKSLGLDGVDDWVDVGNITELNSVTSYSISFWFRENTNSSSAYFFNADASSSTYLETYGAVFQWRASSAHSALNYLTRPTQNVWHHAALTFGSSTTKIFVDGVLRATASNVATTAATAGNTLRIGARLSGSSDTDGYIDEFAIFTEALTDGSPSLSGTATGQVADIYHGRDSGGSGGGAGTPGDLTTFIGTGNGGLVHWWNFEDTANDQVGSNHGTLNGTTYTAQTP